MQQSTHFYWLVYSLQTNTWQVSQLKTDKLILIFYQQELPLMNQPWPEVDQDYPLPLRYFVSHFGLSKFYVVKFVCSHKYIIKVTLKYRTEVIDLWCRHLRVIKACDMSRIDAVLMNTFTGFLVLRNEDEWMMGGGSSNQMQHLQVVW